MTERGTTGLTDQIDDELRREFSLLADEWHEATDHLSSPNQIAMQFAYQRIIGKGWRVLPLIFEDLEARGGQWYWALRAITGENPVPETHVGRIKLMKQDWLDWASVHGLAN